MAADTMQDAFVRAVERARKFLLVERFLNVAKLYSSLAYGFLLWGLQAFGYTWRHFNFHDFASLPHCCCKVFSLRWGNYFNKYETLLWQPPHVYLPGMNPVLFRISITSKCRVYILSCVRFISVHILERIFQMILNDIWMCQCYIFKSIDSWLLVTYNKCWEVFQVEDVC